jgi:ABC-type uncharacterized transport system substrate-binding protein
MRLVRTLALSTLVSLGLSATEYTALASAVKKVLPMVGTIVVVCDTGASMEALNEIMGSFPGVKVSVVHVGSNGEVGKALSTVLSKKPDLLVLVNGDPVVGDGTTGAAFLIQRAAVAHIPTASITEAGVKQGAVIGMGPSTGGKLLTNLKVSAVVGITVNGATPAG